jgi:uncharacterized protein (DUF983 family)
MFKKLYSITHNRCPKCHEGRFFETDNPYNLKKFDRMNPTCTACGESFIPEPGYYYGAMYASYAISVALTLPTLVIFIAWLKFDIYYVLGVLIPTLLALTPLSFRLARLLWINIFVNYDAEVKTKQNKVTPK